MIIVVVHLGVRQDAMPKMLAEVDALVVRSRGESGCLEYRCLTPRGEPDRIVLFERWADRESLAAHGATPAMAAYRSATAPLVIERTLTTYEAHETTV